eukprot:4077410-Pleurochrysis_carterae.AAC.1
MRINVRGCEGTVLATVLYDLSGCTVVDRAGRIVAHPCCVRSSTDVQAPGHDAQRVARARKFRNDF